jgi:hypothetical protein
MKERIRLLFVLLGAVSVSVALAQAPDSILGDWLARLRPFVADMGQPGHDPAKHLIPSAVPEGDEMQKRLGIYAEASAALADYRQAQLGTEETDELRQVSADLETTLRRFAEACVQYADQDLAAAKVAIASLEQFVRDQDAQMAAGKPILCPDRGAIENAMKMLDRASGLAKNGDPRLAGLHARMKALKTADARLRAARAGDTHVRPDVYAHSDAEALKQFAEQVVLRAQPGLNLLQTVIASPDWTEENAIEWADTTQTALRSRTTRRVTVQVAARFNAETRLYTVEISQDRLAPGTWGAIDGLVIFVDPMWEENARQAE